MGQPPYGQQPQGYPPQAPGPYGPPQGQYQPQPQPQPPYGGYPGQPPAPRPRGRGRGGLVVLAVVVAVALLAGGALFLLSGGGDGPSDDGRDYTLTVPEAVQGLNLSPDLTDQIGEEGEITDEEARQLGVTAEGRTFGIYAALAPLAPGDNPGYAHYAGIYGTVEDPEAAVDTFFQNGAGRFTEERYAMLTGERTEVSPSGLDNAVMKCQTYQPHEPEPGEPAQAPICAWADYDTFAFAFVTKSEDVEEPQPLTMDRAAEFAAALRGLALEDQGPE
ncbi:hypothetical protein [Streptomyces sp. B6B3]|uniref:hypothetical protein n=1 Tax=Streptomyces sp. B6B3 TaxID=3153570 RepID=UPI00325F9583